MQANTEDSAGQQSFSFLFSSKQKTHIRQGLIVGHYNVSHVQFIGIQHNRKRSVIHQADLHIGAEFSVLNYRNLF